MWSRRPNPIADDQPYVPAHCSVTLRSTMPTRRPNGPRLGGQVGRRSMPPGQGAVITDPQGTTLTARRFVLENRSADGAERRRPARHVHQQWRRVGSGVSADLPAGSFCPSLVVPFGDRRGSPN
jgi:hypothetical protein